MDAAARDEGQEPIGRGPVAVSATLKGSTRIAEARAMAHGFLTTVRTDHGIPVSARAMDVAQLVVSELVTNARKYAPGPCLLRLELREDAVQISVWDRSDVRPSVLAANPERVGQHGLEIVMAVSQSFRVREEREGKKITVTLALTDDLEGDAADRGFV
ncbi:ATP-binding protein [Streptomyces griseoaurantiacus]|uniref:ATP-binding protein n=1 Tax=Streptomyces griseoaurantiacus TaxID=68213 RepID=UPI0037970CCA